MRQQIISKYPLTKKDVCTHISKLMSTYRLTEVAIRCLQRLGRIVIQLTKEAIICVI